VSYRACRCVQCHAVARLHPSNFVRSRPAKLALSYPSPVCGEGKQIVSGANDVQGGGLFVCVTQPHPALRATLPMKEGEG
jgi:hypothetical protein